MSFAIIFPGQGAQALGMLDTFAHCAIVQQTLAEAAEVLDQDLAALIRQGPVDLLNLTINTQPIMLAVGVALYRVWRAQGGPEPSLFAGHSVGEYAALVAAESLAFKQALPLVRFRAQVMQEAVSADAGGMVAILGLDDTQVQAICKEACDQSQQIVEAVNFNAPGQVIIAGTHFALENACQLAKANGAKATIALAVSAPFHSSLLKSASEQLAQYLTEITITMPKIPVVANVNARIYTDVAQIKSLLAQQASSAVLWSDTIRYMAAQGITRFIECGPGRVLTALNKHIERNLSSFSLNTFNALNETLNSV